MRILMTMRMAVACLMALGLATTLAAPPAEARNTLYNLDIPAQDLGDALETVALTSHHKLLYSSDLVRGKRNQAIKGQFTTEEAVKALLAGTDLKYEVTTDLVLIRSKSDQSAATQAAIAGAGGTAEAGQPRTGGTAQDQKEKSQQGDSFRVAQATSGQAAGATAVDKQGERSSVKQSAVLEEILVTARKRSEDVSKVPVSIAVLTRDDILEQQIQDLADVATRTPGVDFENQGIYNAISIRGITSSQGAVTGQGGYSTTGIYIDDIPIQSRATAANEWNTVPKVFDLDRVEVLRGPQGTLFGAGAEGGIIRFITPQPDLSHFKTFVKGGVGTTDNGGLSYESGVAVGGPIVENELGFRISAWHRRDGGYIDHESAVPGGFTYGDSNWTDSDVLRAAVTFAPVEWIQITPSYYYQHIYYHDNFTFTPAESSAANNAYTKQLLPAGLNLPFSNIGAGEFVNPNYQQEPSTDRFDIPALKVVFNWSAVTLTSSTSYMERSSTIYNDWSTILPALFGLPWPVTADTPSTLVTAMSQNVFAQEVRVQSAEADQRLQWTAGAYYARSRETTELNLLSPNLSTLLVNAGLGTVEQVFGLPPLSGGSVIYGVEPNTIDIQRALFADFTFRVTRRVSLDAGVRFAHNSMEYTYYSIGPLAGTNEPKPFNSETSESAVDPKFGVNFQVNDNSLVYLSATKGDRIGGVNTPFATNFGNCAEQLKALGYENGPPLTFKSDWLWSYELGSKNRWFGGRLQLDGSVFYIDWSDVQQAIGVPACSATFTSNLGKATSKGFDLEALAWVTNSIKLGLGMSYTDARSNGTIEVHSVLPDGSPGPLFPVITEGQQLNGSSAPWIITSSAEYTFALGSYPMYLRAFNTYRSKNPGPYQVPPDPNNPLYNPNLIPNPSTNQLDLHVGTTFGPWDISLYALNVLNAHPVLFNGELNNVTAPASAYTIRPLTVGLSLVFRN
jgi:outer membrane receptor protein involved in Fe transport